MKQFLQDYNLVFAMAAVGCLTIIMEIIASITYYRLICQAEQMGTTKNKYMKAMMGKFTASYKLKREVHNVDCMVEKNLYNMRFLGITLPSWKNSGIYGMALIAIILVASMLCGIYYSMDMQWYMANIMTAVSAVVLLASSEILFQIHRKYKILRLQMTDYMENVLKPKLEREYIHPEDEKKYQMEYFENKEETKQEEEVAPSMEDLRIFEEFIEEYLAD